MFIGFWRNSRLLIWAAFIFVLGLSACSSGSGGKPSPTALVTITPVIGPTTVATQQGAATTSTGSSTTGETTIQAQILTPTIVTTATGAPSTPQATTTPVPVAQAATATDQPQANQPTATRALVGQVPSTGSGSVTRFPDPNAFAWAPVVSGLDKPLDMASLPDNPQHLLIAEQPGVIVAVQNGQVLPDPYLDIQQKVNSQGSEQGLLGMALHPNYAKNGYLYLNYIDLDGNTVIARYQVSKSDPNRADPNSEKILLHIQQPFPNHNGGSMVFGPDGYLYMGLGDGGSEGDPQHNGQNKDVLLAKILRIDVDHGDPYAIPANNPFANGGGKPETWAYGLRNPWRFSFDRLTGDLYIGDVGQDTWEEIDFQAARAKGGENFGWSYREGAHPFRGNPPAGTRLIDPVFEYQHGYGCAVTGGYVYRGSSLPEFNGIYLLSDFCSGRVWGLIHGASGMWQSQELFDTGFNVSSFGQDSSGEMYLFDQPKGVLYRLQRR